MGNKKSIEPVNGKEADPEVVNDTPENLQESIKGILYSLGRQAEEMRKEGRLPAPEVFNMPVLPIETDASEEDQLRSMYETASVYDAVLNDVLGSTINSNWECSSESKVLEWSKGGKNWRTTYSRMGRDMALLQNFELDEQGRPTGMIPQVLVGRDAVNDFLVEHPPRSNS